ncbi:MAG: hypothetical protein PHU23_16125 [Dehalococcoidales bacterium]|nr:hypothetical protein [Dehalococcoidales bacterium]
MPNEKRPFVFNIPAGGFDALQIEVTEIEGFWIFDIQVDQQRNALDDIGAYVLNHDNFLVWRTRQQTNRNKTSIGIPSVSMVASGRLHWGALSFRPFELGQYQLVLDNSHSSFTAKIVNVSAHWLPYESQTRTSVREPLASLGWHDTWKLFEKMEQDFKENHFAEASYNMRTALATLWKQVVEKNSGQPVVFDPGKSTEIGLLQKPMESYVPPYLLSGVRQSWSLSSELAHIEKRSGEEPSFDQALLALRYAYASAAFLLSLVNRK